MSKPICERWRTARLVVALGVYCCVAGCGEPRSPASIIRERVLPRPMRVFTLPQVLGEASGVTLLDDRHLGLIDDEYGVLFIINSLNGNMVSTRRFGEDGDYEDLVSNGSRVFVLRSDGLIADIRDWRSATLDVRRHSIRLPSGCDAEGLAFDTRAGRLLIACRNSVLGTAGRVLQSVIVNEDRLQPDALPTALNVLLPPENSGAAIRASMPLEPSAIAVHPSSGDLYVLSASARSLVVLDRTRVARQLWRVSAPMFEKPEGLAIAAGNDVWVVSEAHSGAAVVGLFRLVVK
jgi:hypothetical protein